jgi:hypothetical protein
MYKSHSTIYLIDDVQNYKFTYICDGRNEVHIMELFINYMLAVWPSFLAPVTVANIRITEFMHDPSHAKCHRWHRSSGAYLFSRSVELHLLVFFMAWEDRHAHRNGHLQVLGIWWLRDGLCVLMYTSLIRMDDHFLNKSFRFVATRNKLYIRQINLMLSWDPQHKQPVIHESHALQWEKVISRNIYEWACVALFS